MKKSISSCWIEESASRKPDLEKPLEAWLILCRMRRSQTDRLTTNEIQQANTFSQKEKVLSEPFVSLSVSFSQRFFFPYLFVLAP